MYGGGYDSSDNTHNRPQLLTSPYSIDTCFFRPTNRDEEAATTPSPTLELLLGDDDMLFLDNGQGEEEEEEDEGNTMMDIIEEVARAHCFMGPPRLVRQTTGRVRTRWCRGDTLGISSSNSSAANPSHGSRHHTPSMAAAAAAASRGITSSALRSPTGIDLVVGLDNDDGGLLRDDWAAAITPGFNSTSSTRGCGRAALMLNNIKPHHRSRLDVQPL